MMDLDDLVTGGLGLAAVSFGLMVLVIVFSSFLFLFESAFIHPYAAQDALQQCQDLGFDSYESYDHGFLSTEALGVQCSHIRNKHEVIGSTDGVLVGVN